jgi:hypothetical protein
VSAGRGRGSADGGSEERRPPVAGAGGGGGSRGVLGPDEGHAAARRARPLVRHGHGPERLVQTGIGPVEVRRVKLHNRGVGNGPERIRFTSAILPRWARRTRSLDALLPILYLWGVSMGDFQEALGALLGKDAPNLSPSVIARLRGDVAPGRQVAPLPARVVRLPRSSTRQHRTPPDHGVTQIPA